MPDVDQIKFRIEPNLRAQEYCEVLRRSGLDARRPVDTPSQIEAMLRGSNLIVTARDCSSEENLLIGVTRAVTDHAYCTYLSDLAVDTQYQRLGIGRRLISETHEHAGLATTLILLSAPAAREYYPHIGMHQHPSCWTLPPTEKFSAIMPRTPVEQEQPTGQQEPWGKPSGSSQSEAHEGLAKFFDGIASEYDEAILRCFPRYPELLQTVADYIPQSSPRRIVDLGCGSGTLASMLAKKFPSSSFTLVDLSEESLRIADSRLPRASDRELLCSDMASVDLPEGSVDVIVSTIAIHHLDASDKQRLFDNCRRWLSSDGIMVFGDQCSGSTASSTEQHHRTWETISRSAGASDEEWQLWMQHQAECDHHESVSELFEKLRTSGFSNTDVVWRYLLWTVFVARP